MNRYARRMLHERDGRNPYGSRGGYVTSRDPRRRDRRDRGEYDEYDMRGRDGHHRMYEEPYGRLRGEFEYEQYDDYDCYDYGDYRGMDMRGRGRGRGRMDYGDDWDESDYGGRSRNSRGQYTSRRGGRRDYGEDEEYKLTKHDIKEWEEDMENDDGTKHFHFPKEVVEQKAMQMGIDHKKFGENALWVATNLKYSDGVLTAKKFGVDRIEYYIECAKEFLEDKDYDGTGEEKLYTYYMCIAKQD